MRTHDEELLRRSSLFHLLPDEDFEKLRPLLQEEHYEFGDVIVRQGEPAEAFYVLIAGRARAIKAQANGEESRSARCGRAIALAKRRSRKAARATRRVRCSTAVDVLRLDREDFLKLLEEEPELRQHVQTMARHRALHGFLYEFSNFGRLPAPALRGMIERLEPVEFPKGRSDHPRRRSGRADVHPRERPRARLRTARTARRRTSPSIATAISSASSRS